ncbi:MAG: hypothetical protein IPP90_11390 [Gemmatimonadaceae bacterium]|nr:hypothetical protein [Gemmatimonadaceae bacterium]
MMKHRLRAHPRGTAMAVAIGLASCMSATVRAQGPTTMADSMALAITIYGVAFTNGTQTAHAATQPELVCVQGPDPGVDPPRVVIDALQQGRAMLLRPMSACKVMLLGAAPRGTSLVVDTLTGKRGISVSVGEPSFATDGSFTVATGYYQHGLSAASWVCKGRRRSDQSWEITSCTMQWIS